MTYELVSVYYQAKNEFVLSNKFPTMAVILIRLNMILSQTSITIILIL